MRSSALAVLLLSLPGWSLAGTPRDLEPLPKDLHYPNRLHPLTPRPHPLLDCPKPPPPEYAYWYWLEEKAAAAAGKPDPWHVTGKRRASGAPIPQPGVALGRAYEGFPEPWPEGPAPREIRRRRAAGWPPARLALEDGFATGDRDYHFHPDDPRSETALLQDQPCAPHRETRAHECKPTRVEPVRGEAAALAAQGRGLFEGVPRHGRCSCASCHTGMQRLTDAPGRYPKYEGMVNRVIGLEERINLCRTVYQGSAPFAPGGEQAIALLLYLKSLTD